LLPAAVVLEKGRRLLVCTIGLDGVIGGRSGAFLSIQFSLGVQKAIVECSIWIQRHDHLSSEIRCAANWVEHSCSP